MLKTGVELQCRGRAATSASLVGWRQGAAVMDLYLNLGLADDPAQML